MRDRDLRYVPPRVSVYWVKIHQKAMELKTDGCTGVPDFYVDACYEHDIHWRTGHTLAGERISTRQANLRFRYVVQDRSPFGFFSPMSWWRWAGVSLAGIWHNGGFKA